MILNLLRKYIGDRAFYRTVLIVALPIMLQNFITNFVSMLDNIMIGATGTEQMTGVSIVNQLLFIFYLTVFGAISGAGIFTAQFYGKKDDDGIRYTFRFKIIVCTLLSVLALIVLLCFGDRLISLYLHEGSYDCDPALTFAYGREYLAVMFLSLLPYAITQAYASTLRETGETVLPMVFGLVAVLTNCLFNYLLIFGKLFFPVMGVTGAAIATVLSRVVECALIIVYSHTHVNRFSYLRGALRSPYIPRTLLGSVIRKGMPLLVNECLWSAGMSLLSMTYSYHGLAVMAGYSISSTVINLFNIAFMAFGTSIGIIVGKLLGAGENEEAIDTDRKLIFFSILISIAVGAITFIAAKYIPNLYKTSEESRAYAAYFIRTCACFMPINAFAHAAYFTLRCGGKTMITFLFDSFYVCVFVIPMAFLFYKLGLSIYTIFPLVQALDLVKCVIGTILIKKRAWVHNIVEKAVA